MLVYDRAEKSSMRLPVNRQLYYVLRALQFPAAWDVSVGAVIFRKRPGQMREYLLLHYPSGHFDFAKGHIEAGETEEETLRRETVEETGIEELSVFPHRVSIKYFYVARGGEAVRRTREGKGIWIFKVVHFYPAQTAETNVTLSDEHIGSLWLPYEEALGKVTFENARSVLRETHAWLEENAPQD